jgi:hypothetical protein
VPVLRSRPGVGYAAQLHLLPGHIQGGRELLHGKRPLRRRRGHPPIQPHPRLTSYVPVYGGGTLRLPGFKDAILKWHPQDPGRL